MARKNSANNQGTRSLFATVRSADDPLWPQEAVRFQVKGHRNARSFSDMEMAGPCIAAASLRSDRTWLGTASVGRDGDCSKQLVDAEGLAQSEHPLPFYRADRLGIRVPCRNHQP